MGKKINIIARCSAFCLVFVLLFGQFTQMYRRDDDETNEIHAFYDEPKDSLDVLYIGSSPLLRGVSSMLMYQDHGFTGMPERQHCRHLLSAMDFWQNLWNIRILKWWYWFVTICSSLTIMRNRRGICAVPWMA